jgi:hypothetical protein
MRIVYAFSAIQVPTGSVDVSFCSLPAQPIVLSPAAVPAVKREAKNSRGKHIVISAQIAVLALAIVLLRKSF